MPSSSITVKPACAGLLVRNPHRDHAPLAAGGETVPYDAWVIRRLADGDVVEVKPGAPAEKPKK